MLMRLASPTDEAAKVYQLGAGCRWRYSTLMALCAAFDDIVGNLQQATAGLTDEQRNAALTTIRGRTPYRAATILAR